MQRYEVRSKRENKPHGVTVIQILFTINLLTIKSFLTLSQMTNFRPFQTKKKFADNNFKFDENGQKFFKHVENTEVKGEIAPYEQFLLFPQCFQKTCSADMWKPGLVWERVKSFPNDKF